MVAPTVTPDPLILRDDHERELWLEQQRSWLDPIVASNPIVKHANNGAARWADAAVRAYRERCGPPRADASLTYRNPSSTVLDLAAKWAAQAGQGNRAPTEPDECETDCPRHDDSTYGSSIPVRVGRLGLVLRASADYDVTMDDESGRITVTPRERSNPEPSDAEPEPSVAGWALDRWDRWAISALGLSGHVRDHGRARLRESLEERLREPTPSSDPRVDVDALRTLVQECRVDTITCHGFWSKVAALVDLAPEPDDDLPWADYAMRLRDVCERTLSAMRSGGSQAMDDAEVMLSDALCGHPPEPPSESGAPTGPGWWCVEAFLRLDDDGAMEHYWRSVEVTELDGTLVFETLDGSVSPCRGFKWNGRTPNAYLRSWGEQECAAAEGDA